MPQTNEKNAGMSRPVILGEISLIRSGYLFRERLQTTLTGNTFVIQLKDIDNTGLLHKNGVDAISFPTKSSEYLLKTGDVLLKIKTNRPIAAVFTELEKPAMTTANFLIISPNKERILPAYLAWFLNSRLGQEYFNLNARGTVIRMINKQILGDMKIPVPDLQTQQKIVQITDLWRQEMEISSNLIGLRGKLVESMLFGTLVEER